MRMQVMQLPELGINRNLGLPFLVSEIAGFLFTTVTLPLFRAEFWNISLELRYSLSTLGLQ